MVKCIIQCFAKVLAPLELVDFLLVSGFRHKEIFVCCCQHEVGNSHEVQQNTCIFELKRFFKQIKDGQPMAAFCVCACKPINQTSVLHAALHLIIELLID